MISTGCSSGSLPATFLVVLARAAYHHGEAGDAPGVDLAADAVVVAVGVPVEGEQAMGAAQGELGAAQRHVVLAADDRPAA